MEFIEKWKAGIAAITPEQQLKATQKGNWVMLIGIIAGMIATLLKLKDFWWIEIILGASLFNHGLTMMAIQQKINLLNKMNEEVE